MFIYGLYLVFKSAIQIFVLLCNPSGYSYSLLPSGESLHFRIFLIAFRQVCQKFISSTVQCLQFGGVAYSIILGRRCPFTFTFPFQRIEIWLLLQNSNYQTFKFESLIKAYSSGRQSQYIFMTMIIIRFYKISKVHNYSFTPCHTCYHHPHHHHLQHHPDSHDHRHSWTGPSSPL